MARVEPPSVCVCSFLIFFPHFRPLFFLFHRSFDGITHNPYTNFWVPQKRPDIVPQSVVTQTSYVPYVSMLRLDVLLLCVACTPLFLLFIRLYRSDYCPELFFFYLCSLLHKPLPGCLVTSSALSSHSFMSNASPYLPPLGMIHNCISLLLLAVQSSLPIIHLTTQLSKGPFSLLSYLFLK